MKSTNTYTSNFVDYLDNVNKTQQINYHSMSTLLHLSNMHYLENNLYTPLFSGIVRPSIIPYTTIYPNSLNRFDMWKQEHEITHLHTTTDESVYIKPKTETVEPVEKTYIDIDVSLNDIGDVIKMLKDTPYDSNTNYNIDLKSLHSILPELEQLNNMIGMNSLKSSILDQLVYFMQDLHISNGSSDFKHTVLYGPPGTGKTEIAKIIGTMYSKIGILSNNIFKKVTRNDLVAGYLGQTAIKTKNVIKDCLGGVLFIDEAYSLANSYEDDSFSKECIDTLCEALSDHKNDLMVIIAGYEKELNESFFRANPGMESRFIWRFTIETYTPKELKLILEKKITDMNWEIENVSPVWFEKRKDKFISFGRDMEMLFSYIKIAHAKRIYGKSKELRKKIILSDLEKGYEMFLANRKKENPISKILSTMYI
jgi:SpoVK/Ycf46/Vps4 family AAA+-type ATPase